MQSTHARVIISYCSGCFCRVFSFVSCVAFAAVARTDVINNLIIPILIGSCCLPVVAVAVAGGGVVAVPGSPHPTLQNESQTIST